MTQLTTPLDELKARLPLTALLVQLQFPPLTSTRHYRSRCLIHGGQNPSSFSANLQSNVWFCFACQRGGDQIDLVQAMRSCDFKEVVRWIADRVGTPISRVDCRELEQRQQARSEGLRALDEEEGLCLNIEHAFYVWFREQRCKLPPKGEWDAKTYNRILWLDYAEQELDATSEARAAQFNERRRAIYAQH